MSLCTNSIRGWSVHFLGGYVVPTTTELNPSLVIMHQGLYTLSYTPYYMMRYSETDFIFAHIIHTTLYVRAYMLLSSRVSVNNMDKWMNVVNVYTYIWYNARAECV